MSDMFTLSDIIIYSHFQTVSCIVHTFRQNYMFILPDRLMHVYLYFRTHMFTLSHILIFTHPDQLIYLHSHTGSYIYTFRLTHTYIHTFRQTQILNFSDRIMCLHFKRISLFESCIISQKLSKYKR